MKRFLSQMRNIPLVTASLALMLSACGAAPDGDAGEDGADEEAELTQALYTDDTPPPLSGTLTATVEGCSRVLLTWPNVTWPNTPEPDESGLRFYRVYRDNVLIAETRARALHEFSDKRNYISTGLNPAQSYTFAVSAVDYAGNESPRLQTAVTMASPISSYCRDTRAPRTPVLSINDAAANGKRACGRLVKLRMSASDPSNWWDPFSASGIAYYNVYRNGQFITRSTNGSYQQYLGQYPDNVYTYAVKAVDRAGNESNLSNSIVHQVPADCRMGRWFPQTIRVLVLPVRPADGPANPFPVSEVYDFVRGGSSFPNYSVRDYINETSYGRLNLAVTAASPNWITLPEPTMTNGSTGYCSVRTPSGWGYSCNHSKMLAHALSATGRDQDDYDFFLFVKNGMTDQHSNDLYSTVHVMGGVTGAHRVALHELSHILGGSVEHSGGDWYCPGRSAGNGFVNVTGLDIYDPHFGCNAISPQGDRYSALGYSSHSYHIPMFDKWLKGFLNPSQTVVAPDGYSEVTLHSAESVSAGNVVRHVIVPFAQCADLNDGTPFFSLEYRTPSGFDADPLDYSTNANPPVNGVQIRLAPWKGVYRGAAETIYLGTLEPDGNTVFSYQRRSITLLEANGQTATIRIGRPQCLVIGPVDIRREFKFN